MDSSALLAVILDEPEARRFASALANAASPLMSAANWFEVALRVDSQDPSVAQEFDRLVALFAIQVVPVSPEIATAARQANQRFGRRSGSKARLNFGDCFAYALSHLTRQPLLFKGNDFTHTDILAAAY